MVRRQEYIWQMLFNYLAGILHSLSPWALSQSLSLSLLLLSLLPRSVHLVLSSSQLSNTSFSFDGFLRAANRSQLIHESVHGPSCVRNVEVQYHSNRLPVDKHLINRAHSPGLKGPAKQSNNLTKSSSVAYCSPWPNRHSLQCTHAAQCAQQSCSAIVGTVASKQPVTAFSKHDGTSATETDM